MVERIFQPDLLLLTSCSLLRPLNQDTVERRKSPTDSFFSLPSSENSIATRRVGFHSLTKGRRNFQSPFASPLKMRSMARCCSSLAPASM